MVCAVCPGLHGVTLAGRILKLRDLKLREDGHLCVTKAFTTHTVRQFNCHQRSKSSDPIPDTPRHVTSPNFAPAQNLSIERGEADAGVSRTPCVAPGGRGAKAVSGGGVCWAYF